MTDLPDLAATEVFFPRPDMPFGQSAKGAYDHMFDTGEATMRIRVFPGPTQAPSMLFFHGNGETSRDYDFAAGAFTGMPCTLLAAEYRGYGPCSGTPSLNTFLDDAHRTLDEALLLLEKDGRRSDLAVMGRSLGSAPAIELASARTEIGALIVESGFALTVPLLEFIGLPATSMGITEEHGPANLAKMSKVEMPTLIIHAQQDELIPVTDARLLFDACRDPGKILLRVPGAGHNDVQMRAGDSYFSAISKLLGRAFV